VSNRQECLADVGALGDMIRNGEDPSIIGKVIPWREKEHELNHMTVAAVEGLQAKINEMGVDKFRALSDDDARTLYNGIADKTSVKPELAANVQAYASGTPQERQALEHMATADPAVQAAIDFAKPYKAPPADDKPQGMSMPTSGEKEDPSLQREVNAYHPAALLRDRAFSDSGKITPLTLAKAYGELQDELRENLSHDPGNKVWQAQGAKLQQTFVNTVKMTNYIEENASRGVDILKVEPTLRDLQPPASDAPATGAPVSSTSTAPRSRATASM
jgi:hypothetical protein